MKHIAITVKSELEDIEPYLKDILTTMKDHDEVTDFSIRTATFTERPVKEHSNNKSISNHEAAEILKLMPKQSDAIKKAIEVLEQEPILDKIRAEIKDWYWQADKQALAKDPCVVDAMVDLFIRTIDKYEAESEE